MKPEQRLRPGPLFHLTMEQTATEQTKNDKKGDPVHGDREIVERWPNDAGCRSDRKGWVVAHVGRGIAWSSDRFLFIDCPLRSVSSV